MKNPPLIRWTGYGLLGLCALFGLWKIGEMAVVSLGGNTPPAADAESTPTLQVAPSLLTLVHEPAAPVAPSAPAIQYGSAFLASSDAVVEVVEEPTATQTPASPKEENATPTSPTRTTSAPPTRALTAYLKMVEAQESEAPVQPSAPEQEAPAVHEALPKVEAPAILRLRIQDRLSVIVPDEMFSYQREDQVYFVRNDHDMQFGLWMTRVPLTKVTQILPALYTDYTVHKISYPTYAGVKGREYILTAPAYEKYAKGARVFLVKGKDKKAATAVFFAVWRNEVGRKQVDDILSTLRIPKAGEGYNAERLHLHLSGEVPIQEEPEEPKVEDKYSL